MKTLYQSYLRAFHKYSQLALESKLIRSITRYAMLINVKANQILSRAALNKLIDLPKLKAEILEAGKEYIKKFMARMKQEKRPAKEKDKDPFV